MDLKTITATLAVLGSGLTLSACDSGKDAKEVEGAKDKKADSKDSKADAAQPEDKKAGEPAKQPAGEGDAKAAPAAPTEHSCGEGSCGAKAQ